MNLGCFVCFLLGIFLGPFVWIGIAKVADEVGKYR